MKKTTPYSNTKTTKDCLSMIRYDKYSAKYFASSSEIQYMSSYPDTDTHTHTVHNALFENKVSPILERLVKPVKPGNSR